MPAVAPTQQRRRAERPWTGQGTRPRSRTAKHRTPADVLTLGRPSVLSLPSLAGIPLEFRHSHDQELLIPLAQRLVYCGYAKPKMWTAAGGDLLAFVANTLDTMIASTWGKKSDDDVELYLSLTNNVIDQWEPREGMRFEIEIGSCGWMDLGKPIEMLEDTKGGLGASFYTVLHSALCTFCYAFDYQRAMQTREYQLEGIAGEIGVEDFADLTAQQLEGYDVFNPDRAVPPSILAAIQNPRSVKAPAKLLAAHRHGPHAEWIESVLLLDSLATKYRKAKSDYVECDLPGFVMGFKQNDDIFACFDDYAQTALEDGDAVVYSNTFDPNNPAEIDAAIKSLLIITKLYSTANQLAISLNGVSLEEN